ncbi:MAG TPA: type II toxin-antitoxin system HicA family toxin [Pyrinomonadaceae bacterium]|nr:type II toxin-antitoxin system HicA family toxin [Pyrinomonadaceae bacterium]
MKSLSGKKLCKILEQNGWLLLRINGSHHIFGRPGSIVRLSVPVHGKQALKSGLFRHLLKQAGLDEKDI